MTTVELAKTVAALGLVAWKAEELAACHDLEVEHNYGLTLIVYSSSIIDVWWEDASK